ncbi:RimJ/RimL family protein N-acetyltransferase [Mumia flava]|uniref:RimJ/RimL family protein N-acetyltransferase n=1 Tax=Mumia flava TaxID=1348852 RepID=A0A2M9B5Z6_9ACTN|nr:GNAT family N-acetyltransferase [Mumia flava]PJJ53364.1 RimJ/RimL family protein N-acetyltransferase [Mumia flava]
MVAQPFATHRLRLRPLQVDDAATMADVLGDPALHVFTGGAPLSADDLRVRYERLVAGSPDPDVGWLNWVVRLGSAREPVGTVQATVGRAAGPAGGLTAEIAWVVGTPWQGRGIATEAAQALVGWLRERGIGRVVAHVHPDHTASASVAAAAGLERTDVLNDGEVRWQRDLGP